MENVTIKLSEALDIMNRKDRDNKPVPFDITYRTFSAISKQGGRIKKYKKAWYLPSADPNKEPEINAFNLLEPVKSSKDPNHFKNRTRNLQLPGGDIVKINIHFIISINNQKVIY